MGLFLGSRSSSKTLLEPANVDEQFLFWKYSPIFLFLIRPNFGHFCTFWALRGYSFGPLGLFLGSSSGSKIFLEPSNVDYQFLFWKYSPIFLFSIRPNFGPFLNLFGPSGLFFGLGSCSKIFFVTFLSFRFSFGQILVLFAHFGLFGAIFGVGVRFKNFLGPTYID